MVTDDVQLIRRILSDDDEAFSILVQKYQKSVHALVWRKVNDFHYAEEITQDTFLQAYKKLSTLKNPNQFAGWLYVIANRLCINWLQRHKPAMQSLEDTPMEEIEESAYNHYAAEQREAEGTKYRYEIVQKLLSKLPESERTVVTLYYLGEMTAKEISKFLGVSVNTITSRLRRARERLQKDQERLVQEVLGGVQLSSNLTENIMRQIADVKPIPPPVAKPLLPWGAFGIATLLVALLLGATGQYLVRFQRPYSFDAVSEPTIEIIDTFIVLDVDSKPDLRNQVGRATSADKNVGAGLQASETRTVSDTQGNSLRFSTAQWTQKADMPTVRANFATAVVDGEIFAIGGQIRAETDEFGELALSKVEMYDPETDTWERKADMPTARSAASTSVVDGKIYAIGGEEVEKIKVYKGWVNKIKNLPTVEMYDPSTDTWTQKADMPTARSYFSTSVMDGKIYAIGGTSIFNEQYRLETVEVYDPSTDIWTKARDMNQARSCAALSVVNGEIYAMGGWGLSKIQDQPDPILSSVEVFNLKMNQWQERTGMVAPKTSHTSSVIDGKIYVMGGYFREGEEYKTLSTIEIYDPATDHWTQEPDMLIGRSGHTTEVIEGQIYIFGGGQ
ncbi:sigma-70 family RNA polymerase sigma factor [Candidatus Poribacteria bacterium]|nr:sigma-70 family RNA polymerase sigma factor [Candidatus Poribacteria bacterium]